MDRVGGYDSWEALYEDERAYDDVVIAIKGEQDAARVAKLRGGSVRPAPTEPLPGAFRRITDGE